MGNAFQGYVWKVKTCLDPNLGLKVEDELEFGEVGAPIKVNNTLNSGWVCKSVYEKEAKAAYNQAEYTITLNEEGLVCTRSASLLVHPLFQWVLGFVIGMIAGKLAGLPTSGTALVASLSSLPFASLSRPPVNSGASWTAEEGSTGNTPEAPVEGLVTVRR